MGTPLVKDLLDLPETVRKGDFVEKIDDAVAHAERTAETFVVTDRLLQSFDRALGLVGSALRDGRSQAAYLHGSFGSGKSHFMALLSLLLRGHAAAWGKPELHELREKHGFVGNKRLLELHFHMVGKKNVESAVFGTYVAFVRQAHPAAVLPGLFADEELFDDAARLLDDLGDEKFFARMNEGAGEVENDDGWGELAGADRWDRARFEEATESTDPQVREALFSALASSWFTSADDQGRYLDFDRGLVVMTRHAKELGYDGIVLFLDELILWLAHRAAEHAWLHNEVQKMVKLVEAQELHQRAVPIVSFIARQRNLADMVGEEFAGAESVRLRDSLKHWEGRFDTIELEDKNLPAIVEKRILRPKDEAARKTFDEAFAQLRKRAGGSWDTLVANETPEAFRKLYPFSPALVEALVALSHSLQRQRTAIKLLVELLVYHMDDLEVGQVMGVGDLFDVLAGGEEAADGVMRARFEAAKQLYEHELLKIIRANRQTEDPAKCQRMRDDHPVRIGCSNCPERACRADNRLAKTLLIASLVPKVRSLEDLTVRRLVQLNHGSLRSQIPDGEAGLALQRLKDWAAAVGQIRLGTQQDPVVSVRLEGVSLKPILDSARDRDQPWARQRIVRDLLFDAMDVKQVADLNKEHGHVWRNTKRRGRIRFGNVRKMGSDQLTCPSELDYQVIVDYPFDEPGYGPNDDAQVLEDYEEQGHGSWTAVWLPSFFSKDVNDLLGDLVVLEHILESRESKRKYLAHLRAEDRERAELDLDNLRNQKKARVQQAIDQAYGLRADRAADVDPSATVDQHVRLLKPGAQLVMRVAASLGDALGATIDALLDARYPRHPKLERQLTTKLVETLVERFGQLVDADDKRIGADRALVADMRGTLGELGLVRAIENAVLLMPDGTLQRVEQARNREGVERPTVGQIRRWIDETGAMGLQPIAEDLVVRCYARAEARTFVLHGKAYAPDPKRPMPDEVELDKPDLPELTVWSQALGLGGTLFAVALGSRALHGDNLKRFEQGVLDKLGPLAGPARKLPQVLQTRLGQRGVHDAPRLATAQSARALVEALEGLSGRALVEALARFEPRTSPSALARQLPQAANAVELLGNDLVFGPFAQLAHRRAELEGADEVLAEVDAVLQRDELNGPLADLRGLANRAQAILHPPVGGEPPPPPKGRTLVSERVDASGAGAAQKLDAVVAQVRAALEEHGDDARLTLDVRVTTTKPS